MAFLELSNFGWIERARLWRARKPLSPPLSMPDFVRGKTVDGVKRPSITSLNEIYGQVAIA